MKIAVFGYSTSGNIGDNIQSLAVAQHIGEALEIVDRDFLSKYDGEPCVVVMNGWFTHRPSNWPPSEKITPIFFGFHMTEKAATGYALHKDYFKRFEPIGCRDEGTADIVRSWGVEAYVSGCATMTFPSRAAEPENGSTFLVDVNPRFFDRVERKAYRQVTHEPEVQFASDKTTNTLAIELLRYYRETAKNIITSRIHCAMPCFAMGIPVIYSGVREYRTQLIDGIGIPTVTFSKFRRLRYASLEFGRPDYDRRKAEIANDLRSKLAGYGVTLAPWSVRDEQGQPEFLSSLKWR